MTAGRVAPIVALIAVGALLVGIQKQVDRELIPLQTEAEFLYVEQPQLIKQMALGYDGLLACLYWTRVVQHYGRESLGAKRYHLLAGLLDITTTLDPQLHVAYRYGAVFLSAKPPRGPNRPDLAVRLLEKGMQANPETWGLYLDLAFVYYEHYQDPEEAARILRQGAEKPDAPPWMTILATSMETRGSDWRTAFFLWQQLYESTDDPQLRNVALLYMQGLRADRDVEQLQALIEQYRQQQGEIPAGWQDLVRVGLLQGIPSDPSGRPYILKEGNVLLDKDSGVLTSEVERDL